MRRPIHLPAIATLALLAAMPGPAQAQQVYRCGNSYAQAPCPGATPVEAADPRSPEQARAAIDKTRRDAQLAREMERDRIAAEKRAGGPTSAVIGAASAASAPRPPASAHRHVKRRPQEVRQAPGTFTAVTPRKAGPGR